MIVQNLHAFNPTLQDASPYSSGGGNLVFSFPSSSTLAAPKPTCIGTQPSAPSATPTSPVGVFSVFPQPTSTWSSSNHPVAVFLHEIAKTSTALARNGHGGLEDLLRALPELELGHASVQRAIWRGKEHPPTDVRFHALSRVWRMLVVEGNHFSTTSFIWGPCGHFAALSTSHLFHRLLPHSGSDHDPWSFRCTCDEDVRACPTVAFCISHTHLWTHPCSYHTSTSTDVAFPAHPIVCPMSQTGRGTSSLIHPAERGSVSQPPYLPRRLPSPTQELRGISVLQRAVHCPLFSDGLVSEQGEETRYSQSPLALLRCLRLSPPSPRDVIPPSISPGCRVTVSPPPPHLPHIPLSIYKLPSSAYDFLLGSLRTSTSPLPTPLPTTHYPPTMLCSTRAIVPPNGFVPYGGRRVAVAVAPSPSCPSFPEPTGRRSSVVELLVAIVVPKAKAEPLRRQRAYQNSPTTDGSIPRDAPVKVLGGVPMCRQRAHRGSDSSSRHAYDAEEEAMGGVPMRRGC
ncbi:hypothetical protein C8F01DRAFT_1255324 [Mycena amicta]|nr:hypothetical protein C8F01DRAFT_1255324 [Mycena amicta]